MTDVDVDCNLFPPDPARLTEEEAAREAMGVVRRQIHVLLGTQPGHEARVAVEALNDLMFGPSGLWECLRGAQRGVEIEQRLRERLEARLAAYETLRAEYAELIRQRGWPTPPALAALDRLDRLDREKPDA